MSVSTLVFLFLALGATLRVTRLVTTDTISLPLRQWVDARYGDASKAAELLNCPWCVSFWVAAAVLGTGEAAGHVNLDRWEFWAAALTISYLTGLAAARLDK